MCDELARLSAHAMKLASANAPKDQQYALHFHALLHSNKSDDIPKITRAAALHRETGTTVSPMLPMKHQSIMLATGNNSDELLYHFPRWSRRKNIAIEGRRVR